MASTVDLLLAMLAVTKEHRTLSDSALLEVATMKGLEPSTSAVTGRRSNQLSYIVRPVVGTVGIEPTTPRV